jgi:glycosyltransferase involved in cell wall biosynthesis
MHYIIIAQFSKKQNTFYPSVKKFLLKTMKIAIIADPVDTQNAGIHFYTSHLIDAILKLENRNEYIFIHPKENKFFEKTTHHIIPRIKKIPGYETYRRWIKIPALLKKLNPDIVIETSHIGPFRTPKNSKRVTIIHDLTPIIFPEFHIKNSVIVHKLALPHVFKNTDLILTPSENTKNDILRLYKTKNNISVIHEGITTSDMSAPLPSTHEKLKNIKQPYVLYLGTIEPRKNLEVLIDAFLDLKKNNNIPHQLVLAGGLGWKTEKILEKAAQDKENIIITDYLSDKEKASLYKHADIFVYPSLYEGFGLPPLEAMSYGIPVICSTGGSLKEIFSNLTLMFEPKDKETLKKHILELTKNSKSRDKLTKNGLEYSKRFTWELTAKKVLEALEKLITQ